MLPEVVAEAARRFADRAAFVAADGWPLTYAELHRASGEAAAGLARHGVGEGDTVALVLPSTPDYVVAYLALAKLGAVTAGVNPRLTPAERAAALDASGADRALVTATLAEGLPAGVEAIEIVPASGPDGLLAGLRRAGEVPRALAPDPDREVALVFTSGTTGEPKAAVFANRQLGAFTRIDVGDRWGGGGAMLAATQFAHVGFMTKLPWYLRLGTTTHLLHRWRAADVLALVSRETMASLGGVAPQIALLLRVPGFDDHDLSALRSLIVGGGPSSPALVEEARRRFNAAYSIRYSSTESGGVGTGTALDAPEDEALFTVGRPRTGVELEVRDDDGRPVRTGTVGEVCLRSPAVMSGYRDQPVATARALRHGWLHTGDLGHVDGTGCLRLAGRADDAYVRGGYNVHPLEVEAVLSAHPGVVDLAVVGRPDPVMGHVGVAVVVPADSAAPPSLEDLRAFAARRLSTYKLPEALSVRGELPLTAMQKVDRRALTAEVTQG
ncbi:long-chain fatty acid--CoA ligase [soil metagenome]